MNKDFYEIYEKINEIKIENLINNSNINIDKNLIKSINKHQNLYNEEKIKDIYNYSLNPNIYEFECLIKKYQTNLTQLSKKEINKMRKFIKKNIKYNKINKKEILTNEIYFYLKNNKLYQKNKNKITLHLDANIKGYKTIYLPLKNECHIFGNNSNTLKDLSFIFHELGHCYQLLNTKEIIFDTNISECYACINEVLMSKNTTYNNKIIKLIHNKILESFCTFEFYNYLYKLKNYNIKKIDKKWIKLHEKYNIPYKSNKWLTDFNSIENPQNILSYTIAYLISLKYTQKSYIDFSKICKSNITLKEIINN